MANRETTRQRALANGWETAGIAILLNQQTQKAKQIKTPD